LDNFGGKVTVDSSCRGHINSTHSRLTHQTIVYDRGDDSQEPNNINPPKASEIRGPFFSASAIEFIPAPTSTIIVTKPNMKVTALSGTFWLPASRGARLSWKRWRLAWPLCLAASPAWEYLRIS
jgi:hypothetical protein